MNIIKLICPNAGFCVVLESTRKYNEGISEIKTASC
jgi:hypothetical protein